MSGSRTGPWKRRLGYRGTALLIMGLIEIAYGIGLSVYPLETQPRSCWLLHELIPAQMHAGAWILCGTVGVVFAFVRAPGGDRWGFMAIVAMPLVRAASYLVSWVIWLLPLPGNIGYDRGWVAAVFYVGWTAFMILEASRPEPSGYAPPLRSEAAHRG